MGKEPETRPFAQKSTVQSRRAAERRAMERKAAFESAIETNRKSLAPKPQQHTNTRAGSGEHFPPPLPARVDMSKIEKSKKKASKAKPIKKSATKKAERVEKDANPKVKVITYTVLLSLTILATLMLGAPILGREADVTFLTVGGILALLFLERLWNWVPKASRKTSTISILVAVIFLAFFGAGLKTQVVIDAQAYPVWSDTAKAYRISEDVYADLLTMRENDRYLELPADQARTYSNEITAAATNSLKIADKWNPASAGELPSPDFLNVYRDVNAAAVAQGQALELLSQDLLQPDPSRQSNIATKRVASVESIALGISELRSATAPYGFDPITPKGPVE